MISVGLVGASDPRHRSFLAALHRRRAGVRIVGLSDSDPAVRQEFAERYEFPTWSDHRALLAEARPSLVAVALHDAGPVVIDALRAGVDVLVAPPVATTIEDLDTIADLAASTGRRVTAAHTYRGHPAARTAKELIDAGRLGRADLMSLIIGPVDGGDQVRLVEAMDVFGWLTGARSATAGSVADDPEDRAFGELIMAVSSDSAALEIRGHPELAEGAGIIQVAGDAGAVEWDLRTGLLRSALDGREPVTVACGPLVSPAEWVLNNLLRKPHPVITTEQSLASTRMWLESSPSR